MSMVSTFSKICISNIFVLMNIWTSSNFGSVSFGQKTFGWQTLCLHNDWLTPSFGQHVFSNQMSVGQMMFDQKAKHPPPSISNQLSNNWKEKHETISLDDLKLSNILKLGKLNVYLQKSRNILWLLSPPISHTFQSLT